MERRSFIRRLLGIAAGTGVATAASKAAASEPLQLQRAYYEEGRIAAVDEIPKGLTIHQTPPEIGAMFMDVERSTIYVYTGPDDGWVPLADGECVAS